MDKEVVKELIQGELNYKNLKKELQKILDTNHRENLIKEYTLLESKLGGEGASAKTAQLIIKHLTT